MNRTFFCTSLLTALALAPLAHAQTPAAEPPKHNCERPGDFPGRLASTEKLRGWQKNYVAYTDCLKKFISDQQALAEPHIKAGNAAIQEYNNATKEFNAAIDAAKENASNTAPSN